MNTAFGLLTSETFKDERFKNFRREVLHQFPQGSAILVALLSMIGDEVTSDPEFNWYEQRFPKRRSPLKAAGGTATETITTDAVGNTAVSGTVGTGTDLYIWVDNADRFNKNLLVQIETISPLFIVSDVSIENTTTGSGYLKARLMREYAFEATASDDRAVGTQLRIVGSTHQEGGSGTYGSVNFLPQRVKNTTQIWRSEFEFTGTAAKTELKYDKTGPYKEQARDALIRHMTDIEKNILFGQRSMMTVTDPISGRQTIRRTMSGIEEYLRLWDAGSDGLSIDGETYAPYSDHGPVTSNSDDLKRIIDLSASPYNGNINRRFWLELVERVGRYSSNRSNDKLVLCGSGAMLAFQELFEKNTSHRVEVGAEAYGLKFTRYVTPFGDFWFKTHPLFNDDPLWRNYMYILDVHSLKWRYMPGRDTNLLKHRQLPHEDLRRDEFLTEAGVEFWNPEHNLLIKGIHGYSHD